MKRKNWFVLLALSAFLVFVSPASASAGETSKATAVKNVYVWADDCGVVHIVEKGKQQIIKLVQFFPPKTDIIDYNHVINREGDCFPLSKYGLEICQTDFNFKVKTKNCCGEKYVFWLLIDKKYIKTGKNVKIANGKEEMRNGGARLRYTGPIPCEDCGCDKK